MKEELIATSIELIDIDYSFPKIIELITLPGNLGGTIKISFIGSGDFSEYFNKKRQFKKDKFLKDIFSGKLKLKFYDYP